MTGQTVHDRPTHKVPSRSPRKRHAWRWILGAVVVLVVLVLALGAPDKSQPAPAPLALPTSTAATPVGPVDGTWDVATGSVAGFRVKETMLGMSNDIAGRTSAVTGFVAISHNRVTSARFGIDLASIKVAGKAQPQFDKSLDTQSHPTATFTLTQPMTFSPSFVSGATTTATASGRLEIRGVSRQVTVTVSDRLDGSALQVAGSIPIAFSSWGWPKGYGPLGSIADHGVAEFLVVLHRR
jgi:polyisoprenoid-binding protein YceI